MLVCEKQKMKSRKNGKPKLIARFTKKIKKAEKNFEKRKEKIYDESLIDDIN